MMFLVWRQVIEEEDESWVEFMTWGVGWNIRVWLSADGIYRMSHTRVEGDDRVRSVMTVDWAKTIDDAKKHAEQYLENR